MGADGLALKFAIIPTRRAAHWEWNYGNLHQFTKSIIYFNIIIIGIIKFIYTTIFKNVNLL